MQIGVIIPDPGAKNFFKTFAIPTPANGNVGIVTPAYHYSIQVRS